MQRYPYVFTKNQVLSAILADQQGEQWSVLGLKFRLQPGAGSVGLGLLFAHYGQETHGRRCWIIIDHALQEHRWMDVARRGVSFLLFAIPVDVVRQLMPEGCLDVFPQYQVHQLNNAHRGERLIGPASYLFSINPTQLYQIRKPMIAQNNTGYRAQCVRPRRVLVQCCCCHLAKPNCFKPAASLLAAVNTKARSTQRTAGEGK